MDVNLRLRLKHPSVNVAPLEARVLDARLDPTLRDPIMNKTELIHCIASRLPDVSERDVKQSVEQLLDQLFSTLVSGGRCEIRGFGSFSLNTIKARIGRNPITNEPLALPAKRKPHFKPGKPLKERVNLGRTEFPIQGALPKDSD